ncbi:MAG: TonB-dependent receptor [Opitutaceae bacterium]|nr:TonB-dependent receptor [Opitutaceae bacterium]
MDQRPATGPGRARLTAEADRREATRSGGQRQAVLSRPAPPVGWRPAWRILLALAGFWLGLGAAGAGRAEEGARVPFNVPSGPAGRTLKLFSEQASRGLLVGTVAARDVRTNAVVGTYTAHEALELMLRDTGLEASEDTTNGAFVVRRRDEREAPVAPVAGPAPAPPAAPAASGFGGVAGRVRDAATNTYLANVAVTLVELGRQTTTQAGGEFAFGNVRAGRHTLLVSHLGYPEASRVVTVAPDGEARVEVELGSDVVKLGKYVVAGERGGQARALQQKRMADSVMDVVSADSAGKLPDGNAAEAVRRLPGVFAEIDQNEGRFIVVRGIDANLNNITMNGLPIGSPGGGNRGAQMDAVPADLISRIEVIKAVTPDMDAQAVGASINIVTPSAFDRPDPFAYGTLAGGYFSGPGRDGPRSASATFGTQFGGGKWGLVAGVSYSYRHYISNRRSGGGSWWPAAPSGPGADIYFPDTQSLFYYDVQRWRQGMNATLEYRPDDANVYFLRLIGNSFKDDEGRDLDGFEFFRTPYPASYTATTAQFAGGRSSIEYRHYVQKHRINNYAVGGRNQLGGDLTLDYSLAFGDTGIRVPERIDWQFRTLANLASEIDLAPPYWKVTPEPQYYNLANYPLRRVLVRSDDQFEDLYHAVANLKGDREFFGHRGFWQVGGKYLWRHKGWMRENRDYLPTSTGFTLDQFDLSAEPRTILEGGFPMTRRIDFAKVQRFLRDHPEYFTFAETTSAANSYANHFDIDEELLAGYAMARIELGAWSVLAGFRIEDTRVKVSGIELPVRDGVWLGPQPYRGSGRYTNLLPGVHARFSPGKNWLLRAAWTNTIGRPAYADIGATRSFNYVLDTTAGGPAVYTGTLTDNNPDLQPYESMNFDVAAEYYFQHTGIFSVGAFLKEVRHPIFEHNLVLRNTVYEGLAFSSLAYTKPLNADRGRISGVEFNYQQQLTMLPSPLDGFGFGVNFTYANSSETLPTRPGERLPFAKQAEKIGNIALFYEKYRVEARLAYTYTGAYVLTFGSSVNSDAYQAARRTLDAKVSYRLNEHVTVFGNVINLTEQPLDEYAGFPWRNSATEWYWWTANFGINWRW